MAVDHQREEECQRVAAKSERAALQLAIRAWLYDEDPSRWQQVVRSRRCFTGAYRSLLEVVGQSKVELETYADLEYYVRSIQAGQFTQLLQDLEPHEPHTISTSVWEKALDAVRAPQVAQEITRIADRLDEGEISISSAIDWIQRFSEETTDTPEGNGNPFKTITDWGELPVYAPEWAVEDLVQAECFTILGGDPKGLKTTLALDVAIGYLTGLPVLGQYQVKADARGPVVIVQTDMGEGRMGYVLQQLLAGKGYPAADHPYHYVCERQWDLSDGRVRDKLLRWILEYEPRLVVLDPLRNLFSGEENSSTGVRPVMEFCLNLRNGAKCEIILIDHLNKPVRGWGGPRGYRLRGAGSKFGAGDSILIAEWLEAHAVCKLSATHRYEGQDEPIYYRLIDRREDGGGYVLATCDPPADPDHSSQRVPIRERVEKFLMKNHDTWHTCRAVRDAVRGNHNSVRDCLLALAGSTPPRVKTQGNGSQTDPVRYQWYVPPGESPVFEDNLF